MLLPEEKARLIAALTAFVDRKAGGNDSLVCTVDSYDATTKTCYCVPLADFPDIQQVRICPDSGTGNIVFPKVGSKVLVSFMSDSSAYISMFSEIDAMYLGGDANGGLVKVVDLVTKLNNLENKLNSLLNVFTVWVPVPNDGAASLKALTVPPVTTQLTPTVKANIENTIIKHGTGT